MGLGTGVQNFDSEEAILLPTEVILNPNGASWIAPKRFRPTEVILNPNVASWIAPKNFRPTEVILNSNWAS